MEGKMEARLQVRPISVLLTSPRSSEYCHREIENTLRTEAPDEFLRFKWFPHFWEKEGRIRRNYMLWAVFVAIIALFFTWALNR
jgi:hypothetical protein